MDNQTGHLFEKHSTYNIMDYTERVSNKRLPADYGITGFQAENLPILPATFKLIPRQNKDGKEYKPDPGVLKRLKIIRELFDKCEQYRGSDRCRPGR
ncbi:hypothetical protein HW49_04280 [Porphyromonadaceae bacterium COT-184 OH4590]|nr:hypothetical protein HW49_04280 [Porphyromonadaceae bacterium COT-184 OH4590]